MVGGGGRIIGMQSQLCHIFEDIVSLENLFVAWQEFTVGKRNKKDMQAFELHVADNIIQLQTELANGSYKHGSYYQFGISDPKPRVIHKATVRDRVLHHAIYRQLYPFFDKTFIADTYSCRMGKGIHRAMNRFRVFARKVSRNNTKTCWVLKCDIRKFFASIDHAVLIEILAKYIPNLGVMLLLEEVIDSFSTKPGVGLPLGNLTSQLFCNIYMNQLDQFVKHKLKAKYYIRYADDFVLLSQDRQWLEQQIPLIAEFLETKLKLFLHPDKVYVKTLASGIDFLGWVHFPKHRVVRTVTKKRMLRRIREHPTNEALQSYLGMLKHGDSLKIRQKICYNIVDSALSML